MSLLLAVLGLITVLVVVGDAFEVIVLPRRVTRQVRLVTLFYRATWRPWQAVAMRFGSPRWRDWMLSLYGPLSLPALLTVWAAGAVAGFAMLYAGLDVAMNSMEGRPSFAHYAYFSGVTFFTLGYGDLAPTSAAGRVVAVLEAGTGFGLLAIVIGYLPVIYQSFSRRETAISLLDARAGSPPTAELLLRRHVGQMSALSALFAQWELWAAECLESTVSYPVLAYFRSQHNNQSWLAALTALLDTCVLVMAVVDESCAWQARLTFAMGRHVLVDLAQVYSATPCFDLSERLSDGDLDALRERLRGEGLKLRSGEAHARVRALRGMYEPYAAALADRLSFSLPAWCAPAVGVENWQTSAWERLTSAGVSLVRDPADDHEEA